MKQVKKSETASVGTGGGDVTMGTNGGNRKHSPSTPILPENGLSVKPTRINTAAGGPTAWAACDGIFSLAHILVERGLVTDGPELDAAVKAAWMRMGEASYLLARDLEAWPEPEVTS